MLLLSTWKGLLLVVFTYAALWTCLQGEADQPRNDFGSQNGSNESCVPCDVGTHADQDSCACETCNCSLLAPPRSSSSWAFFTRFFGRTAATCNCTGFCPNTSMCLPCEAGYNNSAKGQAECQECPLGTYSSDRGAEFCKVCGKGNYSDVTGAQYCMPCAAGKYSAIEGATSCTDCSKGHYNSDTGQISCTACLAGTYSNTTGATECTPCSSGTYNPEPGRSSCTPCSSGYICNTTGCEECLPCQAGWYSSDNPLECQQCPKGHYAKGPGNTKCSLCGNGTVCKKQGCEICGPCEAGHEPNNAESCQECRAGTFSGDRDRYCKTCAAGYYQMKSGQSSCNKCPKGYYCQTAAAAPVDCPAGANCPAGSSKPMFCKNFYTFSDSKQKCVPKQIFYITITLICIFVVLILTLMGCSLYWNCVRKKTSSYEKLPLSRTCSKKYPVSEPVYSGH